jgi:hypothetical protein
MLVVLMRSDIKRKKVNAINNYKRVTDKGEKTHIN